jgi:hypothetical protein
MSDSTQQALRQAYDLIKAKKRDEAVQILLPILQADENNANAWWLLANALTDPNDAREALENVLRLRPDHDKAAAMLEKINQRFPPPAPEPEPEPEPADAFDFGGSDDPFGAADPFAVDDPPAAQADPFGGADSFGAPASSADPFGTPASSASSADPFGAAEPFGAPAGDSGSDPFGSAEPFGGAESLGGPAGGAKSKRSGASGGDDLFGAPVKTSKKSSSGKSGTNPLVIILAIVGIVALCACLVCGAITVVLPRMGIAVLENVVQELDEEGFVLTLEAGGFEISTGGDGSSLPGDIVQRGSLNYGESRRDTLSQGQQHGWTFNGSAGDNVRIEMLATSNDVDAIDSFVALYDPSRVQIASNDDGGSDYNSLLDFTLPSNGTYTILARGFGFSGGGYEIRLNRR